MKIFSYDCIVIGTGAAGYNAACRLKQFGKNVAIVWSTRKMVFCFA